MCREDELILCCARSRIDDSTGSQIASLLDQGVDWNRLFGRTIHHRVTPLVYRNLLAFRGKSVPAGLLTAMAQRCGAIALRNLKLSAEIIRLGEWLGSEGIPFIAYKGPALAVMAYGNIALREFGDLDILVRSQDYQGARRRFEERGYRLIDDWGWECTLVDERQVVSIDLHEFLTPRQFPVGLSFERMFGRVASLPVAGGTMRTLCAEDMLLVLCVQLMKDTWGPRSVRISKVCDIAEMLHAHPNLDWDVTLSEARRSGVLRMLRIGLRSAQELLGAAVPPKVVGNARDHKSVTATEHIRTRLLNEANAPATGPLSSEQFRLMVTERWRERLYPWYLAFKEHLIPNDRDRAVVSLPSSVEFLYYLIRPFRVAGTYGKAAINRLIDGWACRDR